MSVFTALTRTRSGIDGVEFEAVIESTFNASIEMTSYPVEHGVNVADHAIVMPVEYTMTVLASNNPLQPGVTDFIGGAVSNFIPGIAGIAGAFSGLLSAAPDSTGSVVLQSLVSAMVLREPVTITDGDIELSDMMITNITRTNTIETEAGLECEITFQELARIDRAFAAGGAGSRNFKVAEGDGAKTRIGEMVENGHARIQTAGKTIRGRASEIFNKLPGVGS